MRVLLYGGAFNPVHFAHIKNIELACRNFSFDKIIIIPNRFVHFKEDDKLATINDRLAMLDLALAQLKIKENLPIELSRIELNCPKRLCTNEVVNLLKKDYQNAELFFLLGSDQARQLDRWQQIAELRKKVKFIVTKRSEEQFNEQEFLLIDNELMDYNSTMIRHYYTSSGIREVDQYIREQGLYLKILIRSYLNEKRAHHCENVAKLAVAHAEKYGIDQNKAYIAGMLHDIGKQLPMEKQRELIKNDQNLFEVNEATIHAFSAYHLAKDELKITDDDILAAIRWHTTAYFKMSDLAKLIYVSDMLSAERDFPDIEKLRQLLAIDLNECYKQCFLASYRYLVSDNVKISAELRNLKEKIERNDF